MHVLTTASSKQTLNIGQINFINCLPINLERASFDYQLTQASPSKLNLMLRSGELDLAPISSYEYLANKPLYQLIEGVSISSKIEADSVIFIANNDIRNARKIYVTNKSASSVNLLKIILVKSYGLKLEDIEFESFEQASAEMDYKLLIGDEALIWLKAQGSKFKANQNYIDLGEEWFKLTDLPMVFGLWVMNKKSQLLDQVEKISQAIQEHRDYALGAGFPDLIIQAYSQTGISKTVLKQYFNKLSYGLTDEHKTSLELFERYLKELKLL